MANTTTPVVPITLLGAVNDLLASVGQSPVASLQQADMSLKAQQALQMLNEEAVIVQQRGWNYNTERELKLDPDPSTGAVSLPANCLQMKPVGYSARLILGQRGINGVPHLYDLKNSTFNIAQTVCLEMVVALEFADIPPPVRWYIVAKAGFRFAADKVPSGATGRYTQIVEQDALAWAEDYNENESGDTMVTVSPYIYEMRRR